MRWMRSKGARVRREFRNTAPVDLQDWWSGGELVPLELNGTEQGVFIRREGSGPSMTLLHGFPSSSHDWAKVALALAERYALTICGSPIRRTTTSAPPRPGIHGVTPFDGDNEAGVQAFNSANTQPLPAS